MVPFSQANIDRGLVGGSTFRRTPISRSPLDKNPMPGHLSELPPVNAVNTAYVNTIICSSTARGFIEDILVLTRNIEMNNTGPYV